LLRRHLAAVRSLSDAAISRIGRDQQALHASEDATLDFERREGSIVFYAFDMPFIGGLDLQHQPLEIRRELLRETVAKLPEPIRYSETFDVLAADLMAGLSSQEVVDFFHRVIGRAPDAALPDRKIAESRRTAQ
jgi:hypothetical protein